MRRSWPRMRSCGGAVRPCRKHTRQPAQQPVATLRTRRTKPRGTGGIPAGLPLMLQLCLCVVVVLVHIDTSAGPFRCLVVAAMVSMVSSAQFGHFGHARRLRSEVASLQAELAAARSAAAQPHEGVYDDASGSQEAAQLRQQLNEARCAPLPLLARVPYFAGNTGTPTTCDCQRSRQQWHQRAWHLRLPPIRL